MALSSPSAPGLGQVAIVAVFARNAEHARLFVKKVGHLLGGDIFLLGHKGDNRRIEGSAAGAHHKSVQRGKTHAGVDNLAVLNGGDGRTVSEMAGDELESLKASAGQLAVTGRNITVGGSVEAVAAYFIFLVILIGYGKHICLRGHGQMEAVVENNDLGGHRFREPRGRHGCP